MSGIEPILIGAGIGAAASGITGGNPLQGALMGAAGGGLGGLAGGAGGAASGAASGGAGGALASGTLNPALAGMALPGSMASITAPVTAAAPAMTSANLMSAATGATFPMASAAQVFPVLSPTNPVGMALPGSLPGSANWAAPHLPGMPMSEAMNPATMVDPSGLFDSAEVLDYVVGQAPETGIFDQIAKNINPKMLSSMQGMMPGQQKQQPMQAPGIRKGQPPQKMSLLDEQMYARPQRRRLSLV